MNNILSGLAGAAILAVALGLVWLVVKFWKVCAALTASFKKVADGLQAAKVHYAGMSAELSAVSLELKKLSGELEFLRTVMTGGTPAAEDEEPGAPATPRTPSGKPIPKFPTWQPFVASPADVPDATVEDTEVIDTSDEDFVQQEAIDEIRGQGFAAGPEADPMENPPGVTASV